MPMTVKDRALFLERSQHDFDLFERQARRAGKLINYRLEDLRSFVENRLARVCPYCQTNLSAASFVLDHRMPVARGGRFNFRNLEVSCSDCHTIKGVLDAVEFTEVLNVIRAWPKSVRNHFLARLKEGATAVPARLPRLGSLEWFTGADEPHAPLDVAARRYKSKLLNSAPNVAANIHPGGRQ